MESKEIAVIEARMIVADAYAELICETELATEETLRAEGILLHACDYLFEQIPFEHQDIWR